jgi:hypothetical protein
MRRRCIARFRCNAGRQGSLCSARNARNRRNRRNRRSSGIGRVPSTRRRRCTRCSARTCHRRGMTRSRLRAPTSRGGCVAPLRTAHRSRARRVRVVTIREPRRIQTSSPTSFSPQASTSRDGSEAARVRQGPHRGRRGIRVGHFFTRPVRRFRDPGWRRPPLDAGSRPRCPPPGREARRTAGARHRSLPQRR